MTSDQDRPAISAAKNGLRAAERFKFWFFSLLGYWAIRLIGCTLRWRVEGWENLHSIHAGGKRVIFTFWHGRIFPGTYFFRNRGIVVMTSQNKDGEYIARVIRRFGFGAARGSSSRGAKGALVEIIHELRSGNDVAFTIDGPRGPRYIAKTGAVWVAAKTGDAIFPFHMTPGKSWIMRSWDQFHVPRPFTRVLVLMGKPIYVREHASADDLASAQEALQHSLEDLLHRGDAQMGVRH